MDPQKNSIIGSMRMNITNYKHAVWATLLASLIALPAFGFEMRALYDQLKHADADEAAAIARQIRLDWAKSGSDTIDLLFQRGREAQEDGDIDAAIEHFTAAIDHAPEFADAYFGRAQVYFAAGQTGPALADLEKVLSLNPNHFDAIYGLANIFEELDQPKQAYEAYALVLGLHPHYLEAQAAMARLKDRVKGSEI